MRLNGWQRIGIVASVVWFVVGGLWGIHEVYEVAGRNAELATSMCLAGPKPEQCDARYTEVFTAYGEDGWKIAALVGLAPGLCPCVPCAMDTGWI